MWLKFLPKYRIIDYASGFRDTGLEFTHYGVKTGPEIEWEEVENNKVFTLDEYVYHVLSLQHI